MKSSVVGQHQMNTKRAVSMGDFNYKAPQIFFIDDDDKQQLLRTSVESHYILRPMTTTPMMTYWSRPTRYGHYGIEKYGPNHLLLSAAVPLHYRSLGTKYPNASLGGQQWMTLVRICTGAFVCTGTCPGGESAQSWACLSSSVHHQHPLSSSSSWYYTTPIGH